MNRYQLTHRPETDLTDQLGKYLRAIESVAMLYQKLYESWLRSAPCKSNSYLLIGSVEESFFICAVDEKDVGIGFKVGSVKNESQPPFTIKLPLSMIVTKTREELADHFGLQLFEAQNNYNAAMEGFKRDTPEGGSIVDPTSRRNPILMADIDGTSDAAEIFNDAHAQRLRELGWR